MSEVKEGTALESTAEFARAISEPESWQERLQRGVERIAELIEGCDHAGVTMFTRDGVETTAATSDVVLHGDQLQYDLNEGPCLDSLRVQSTVVSDSIASDRRWPVWGPAVAERLHVGSMLAVLLYTNTDSLGALNLYSGRSHAYDIDDIVVAQALAAHLAVAIADGRKIESRGTAMVTRTVIGQAEGILMERFKITADQAFEILRQTSQNLNRKLVWVAEELASTGSLPGAGNTTGGLPDAVTVR